MSTDTHTQNEKHESGGFGRRDFMRRAGAGTLGAATVGYGSLRLDHGPVQSAQANPLLVGLAGAAAVGAVGGWLLRDYDPLGLNPPPEGLSPEALHEQIYERARARWSNNESTFMDNANIINGLENTLWEDGKQAAVEAIADGQSEEDAAQTGRDAVAEYASVVIENLLNSWNESVNEAYAIKDLIDESDLDKEDAFHPDLISNGAVEDEDFDDSDAWLRPSSGTSGYDFSDNTSSSYELPDGRTMDVQNVIREHADQNNDPTDPGFTCARFYPVDSPGNDDESITYLHEFRWSLVLDHMMDIYTSVSDGVTIYVDNVYQLVEDGDLEPEDLLTSRDIAGMLAEDEENPNALADLSALNIPVDPDREALIELDDDGETIQASGFIGFTGDGELEVGTIDPDEKDGGIYFTSDVGEEETTEFETFRLEDEFEILSFTDGDGNEFDSTSFESREAHSDDNYISREEWEESQERQLELIEQYQEDAPATGGFADNAEGFLSSEIYGIPVIGWAIGLAGAGILFGGND